MAEDEVADLLSETLKEEKEADSKLNRIAIKSINKKAEAVH
jgi:ferritin-like metal-binding protein YciE